MRFAAKQHLAIAKYVQGRRGKADKHGARTLFQKVQQPCLCANVGKRQKIRGICIDGFDRTSLTPDWIIIETQLLRLAPPTDDSSFEKITHACEENNHADESS